MAEFDFEAMVPGMPADEAGVRAELKAQLQAQGSQIANTSPFSPFFLLLGAIFGSAWLWLRGFILNAYLPSIFSATATGAALDIRALQQDEARKPAVKARGNITFIRSGTVGNLNVPANTILQTPPIEGVAYRFKTLAIGTIPDGESQAAILSEAEFAGAAYNLGDGYLSVLPVAVDGIIQVTNLAGWLTVTGQDLESDDDLRERLKLKWRRQSSWHIDDSYRSLISDVAGIDPGNIYFDHSAPRGPGSADAFIVTDSGLPSPALVELADDHINAEGNHGEGDDLRVWAMPALPVAVNITLTASEGATDEEKLALAADATDLIRAAFRQSAAYPTVERVAPFQRLARSAYGGAMHVQFSHLAAVDWTLPAADPEPLMELPVIQSAALDLAAVVDKGGGKVGLPASAHGIADGTKVTLTGTDNYDGTHTLDADSSADEIVIVHAYTAEVLAGAPVAEALVIEVAA